jgi:hypothetical protein
MRWISPFIATIILVIVSIFVGIVVYMHWSWIIKSIVEKGDVNCFGAKFKIANFYSPKTEFKYSREISINNTVNFELKDHQVRIVIDT